MYATFAMREQVGGRGEAGLAYWIMRDDQNWYDVVKGDGGSYRAGGPSDMYAYPTETKEEFVARVADVAKMWGR